MKSPNILVFGGAVVDIPLCPVDASIFENRSTPLEQISITTGGDALNESLVLAALGDGVRLCTVLGTDGAGDFLLQRCEEAGVDTSAITRDPTLSTGINIVLVDPAGERRFVTSSSGTLRKFALSHTERATAHLTGIKLANFASIFVSPLFTPEKMALLFRRLKEQGITLCADMTRCKHGERVADLQCCLPYLDYLFPNEQEAAAVTGEETPEAMADCFLAAGVKHVVIKLGKAGCFVKSASLTCHVPGYLVTHCVDTTGAGDTFAAGFLHGLNLGMTLLDCARFANACASLCVEQVGATGAVKNEAMVWERWKQLKG